MLKIDRKALVTLTKVKILVVHYHIKLSASLVLALQIQMHFQGHQFVVVNIKSRKKKIEIRPIAMFILV